MEAKLRNEYRARLIIPKVSPPKIGLILSIRFKLAEITFNASASAKCYFFTKRLLELFMNSRAGSNFSFRQDSEESKSSRVAHKTDRRGLAHRKLVFDSGLEAQVSSKKKENIKCNKPASHRRVNG